MSRILVFVVWVVIGAAFLFCGCYAAVDTGRTSSRWAVGSPAEKWAPPEGGLYVEEPESDSEDSRAE